MKKVIFILFFTFSYTLILAQGGGGREPAGGKSGREGGGGGANRGGGEGRATYEKERTAAMASEAERNRGMNNDKIGGTNAGTRDAGTASAREKGSQAEMDKENAKSPDGRKNQSFIDGTFGKLMLIVALGIVIFGIVTQRKRRLKN
jgi:hypothetical protein